jgi:hypothetical protein
LPDSRHIIVPDSTRLPYSFIVQRAQGEGLAYKVRASYLAKYDRLLMHNHCGEFDPKDLIDGEWFAWARNGQFIDKEVIYAPHPNL